MKNILTKLKSHSRITPHDKLQKLILFSTLLIFISILGYKVITLRIASNSLNEQKNELTKELDKMKDEEQEIKSYEKYVGSDEYIEDIAREKLNMRYEGEIIFVPKK